MKFLRIMPFIFLMQGSAYASGSDLVMTARLHFENREYYNAITEIMRYQFLYPEGALFADSMVILGEAYYLGGDPASALSTFSDCYTKYPDTYMGQQALFYSGYVRMMQGSYYYAARMFQQYNYVYKDRDFYDDSVFNLCVIRILAEDYSEAQAALDEYRKLFPDGKYYDESVYLSQRVEEQKNRPLKSTWIAGISSAIIPGLGYIYTEKYLLGIFSFLSNAGLIYLIYDGYRDGSMFRTIVFSVIEYSFYSWSVTGSIRSAMEYNDNGEFSEEILLRIKAPF